VRLRRLIPRQVKRLLERRLIDEFHRYYYLTEPWKRTSWMGVPTQQYPGDMVVFQQIIWDTRPELIVETGTLEGGSALYFASLFDLLGQGEVLSIDIDHSKTASATREHPRVTLLTADSTAETTRAEVRRRCEGRRVMLHLDADHRREAVLAELLAYADLVREGCYAVVADTNIYGHPVNFSYGDSDGGPYEAVSEFLRGRNDFEIDHSREYQLVTFAPNGFLRRRSSD
jgi:cephalosporin hydroxylase